MRWLIRNRLKSEVADTRRDAIERLCQGAMAKEAGLFASALLDENAAVRSVASSAFGILRETAAEQCISLLLPWLKDADFSRRLSAAQALDLLGWRPSTSEERVLYAVALGNFNSISPKEEAALEILLPLLKNNSESIRFAVVQTLEQMQLEDPRIVAPLIDLLDDTSLPVRVTALQALGNSRDEKRIPALLSTLKSPTPQMREIAVTAIGKTGDAKYLQKILPLLKDVNFEVRLATIAALGRINGPDSFAPLVSMLNDPDTDIRKVTIESLARLKDVRTTSALIPMLIDMESSVRHTTANMLQALNPHWQTSKEAQDAIPFLEASLKHNEYWVRESAAKTLQRIQNPD